MTHYRTFSIGNMTSEFVLGFVDLYFKKKKKKSHEGFFLFLFLFSLFKK